MIEVKDVVKTFDGFRALDGVTMTVPRGAVYGLVWPNGAGKSTLIRHLTGVYRPDSGELLLGGEPVYENHVDNHFHLCCLCGCYGYVPASGCRYSVDK